MHFTNITRSADKILSIQKQDTQKKIDNLNKIAELVDVLDENLEKNNFSILGVLLRTNWENKKKLANGITNPDIEEMVDLALNNYADGCKIAGAGGGGFLISYVLRNSHDHFRKAMDNYQELPFMLYPYGSKIIFNINNTHF